MTGAELIDGLVETGSGAKSLAPVRKYLCDNPHCTADELAKVLEQTPGAEVTARKARHLADGRPLVELLGTPPKQCLEAHEQRMGQIIAAALGRVLES